MAVPGWPFPTFSTASMASPRAIATARWSTVLQAKLVTTVGEVVEETDVTWHSSLSRGLTGLAEPTGIQWGSSSSTWSTIPFDQARADDRRPPLRALTATDFEVPVTAVDSRSPAATSDRRSVSTTVRAYVALTKPRIIELLLVTTVPAMVLAARGVPGMNIGEWTWLVVWTLVGGTLAAGSANAINCYLDRDIDLLMTRTRRRPLPAHQVEPERAVVFGLVLGVISFAVMVWFVNLTAAFLTLLAIGFYIVVYTIMLKRTTTQNIVIGGAAGALPPVIGWAAVTGSVALPAVILFAIVFYWTPPHFWALSLRIRRDYEAAHVPMLPVVRGIPETTRQIGLYTILLVAISLVLFAVARMGLIYLVAAVVLGGIFIWQSYRLWRAGDSEERSTAGAIRLYKYSITYLTLLFAAVALDALLLIPIG